MAPKDIDISDIDPALWTTSPTHSSESFDQMDDEETFAVDDICAATTRGSFYKILSEGHYSDISVVCRGKEFKIHRAIVCTQSGWFEKAFLSPPKKRTIRSVTLDEDPDVFQHLLEFLYTGTYTVRKPLTPDEAERTKEIQETLEGHPRCTIAKDNVPARHVRRSTRLLSTAPAPPQPETAPKSSEISFPSEISHSVNLFIMAQKYGIPALQLLVRDRFYVTCKDRWVNKSWSNWDATKEFEDVVLEVYVSTEEVNTPLWKALCKLICIKKEGDKMKERMGAVMGEHAELGAGVERYMLEVGGR
ncbi:hypothetical protein FBEOM_8814 [Fusarium beomiforme]|uniref:BTB domain-containing protein n=1 Tax=Fusarium beomiforme TaxID=44412 RepID=A0A9P5DU46_9HYPO|nr:hypothetical protein FBEOM_8814 [Fusarium beomiforme]